MHTTSRPRSRRTAELGKPLKRIALKVTAQADKGGALERSASAKGIAVERHGKSLAFSIVSDTPEGALAKIKLLAELFSSKS